MTSEKTDGEIAIDDTARAWIEWCSDHPFRAAYYGPALRALAKGKHEIEIPAVLRSTDPGQP